MGIEPGPDSGINERKSSDPLHGVTLESILTSLVGYYGWERLGLAIEIRCFNNNPDMQSSLKFLRRTPWARKKVEDLYLFYIFEKECGR